MFQQARKPTMYESFIIASCRDFQIMQVTTAKSVNPQRFLSSEKGSLFLPPEMSAVHFDHTTYYYSGHNELPGIYHRIVYILYCYIRIALDDIFLWFV